MENSRKLSLSDLAQRLCARLTGSDVAELDSRDVASMQAALELESDTIAALAQQAQPLTDDERERFTRLETRGHEIVAEVMAQQAQPEMPPEQDCIAAMQRAIREKGPDKSTSLELARAAYDAVLALFAPKSDWRAEVDARIERPDW